MAKTYREYFARGRGGFPIDMLRHDQCWPCDSTSVSKIEGDVMEERSVRLASNIDPIRDRWLSFGWSINERNIWEE